MKSSSSALLALSFASLFFASLAHAQGECPYPSNGGIDMSIYPTCSPNPQPTNPSYSPGGGSPPPYYGGGGPTNGTVTPPYSGQQPTGGGGSTAPGSGIDGARVGDSNSAWDLGTLINIPRWWKDPGTIRYWAFCQITSGYGDFVIYTWLWTETDGTLKAHEQCGYRGGKIIWLSDDEGYMQN